MYLWLEFRYAVLQAFRTIIPDAQDRIPITVTTAVYPVALYAPFIFLAYLTRRPDTYPIRLLLLPSVITSILVAAYRFTWTVPELNVYNWGQCLFAAVAIAKALQFALTKEGMLKIGESRPGVRKGKDKAGVDDRESSDATQQHPYVATWLYDAIEVSHTMRGFKWKFGQGIHIPRQTRPLERSAFLEATFWSFVKNYLKLDFLESLLKLFPGVGEPMGGSMFYPQLSLPVRFVVSTSCHILTGAALLAGFNMVYDLITFIAVWLFDGSPESWPPVMDDPWHADSMHRFWARDWHQLLRETFIVYGGYPGKWIAGKVGMVLGTFAASGLFHECAMYAMCRGFDHAATIFFAIQGPILILERVWRRVTGRRVSGIWGRLWVYFDMFVLAQPMVNSWHRRGLGGGMVIPPHISPSRWILLPVAKTILTTFFPPHGQ
ncbi:hypothetical protein D9619_006931 [Psilocybe cf. subviscida]|uniref:Wax synthase domain-containing protein n=1 Tax=Psilocybe cf. subviscida TaxID=2480587 RepID=A0A8H5EWR5_9AGAR|nr:hypothetical protein D9619_006931 [Psilocybe cf. subviscida]